MCPHVLGHDIRLREPFAAALALIWLVPCVGLDMSHGFLSLSKSSAVALASLPVAHVFTLSCANVILAQMACQRVEIGEGFVAAFPVALVLLFCFCVVVFRIMCRRCDWVGGKVGVKV